MIGIRRKYVTAVLTLTLLLMWFPQIAKGEKVYRIEDVIQLNRALVYILPPAPNPGTPSTLRPNGIKIEPGMKLVFRGTPLRAQETNTQTPVVVGFEWVAPQTLVPRETNRFTREDYFFFQYMLAAGVPVNCREDDPPAESLCNPTLQFEKIKEAIKNDPSPPSFLDRLSQRTLVPAFRSLTLSAFRSSPHAGARHSPLELRELLAEPSLEDFENGRPSQSLRLQFPGLYRTVEIEVYRWSAAFFNDPVNVEQRVPSSPWYVPGSNPSGSRGYIEVMVPVRIMGKTGFTFSTSDYFPAYFSVADLERKLGAKVRGLRRDERFVGDFADTKGQLDKQKLISPNDGYFTIWFDKSSKGYGAKAVMRVVEQRDQKTVVRTADDKKRDILIAPGDVLILEQRRLSATDHPEVR